MNEDTNKSHELSDSDLENVSGGSRVAQDTGDDKQYGDDGNEIVNPDIPADEDGSVDKDYYSKDADRK